MRYTVFDFEPNDDYNKSIRGGLKYYSKLHAKEQKASTTSNGESGLKSFDENKR